MGPGDRIGPWGNNFDESPQYVSSDRGPTWCNCRWRFRHNIACQYGPFRVRYAFLGALGGVFMALLISGTILMVTNYWNDRRRDK
jgi:hypothetical protein